MPGSFSTTSNFDLRYMLGASNANDIDEGFQRLAEDCDSKLVGYVSDTLAKRPAAGIPNRLFYDTTNARLQHDNGTSFDGFTLNKQGGLWVARGHTILKWPGGSQLSEPTVITLASFEGVQPVDWQVTPVAESGVPLDTVFFAYVGQQSATNAVIAGYCVTGPPTLGHTQRFCWQATW